MYFSMGLCVQGQIKPHREIKIHILNYIDFKLQPT